MSGIRVVFDGVQGNNKQARSAQNLAAVVTFIDDETAGEVAEQAKDLIAKNPPEEGSKFQGSIVVQDGPVVSIITRCYDTARASAAKRSWGFMGQAIALAAPSNPAEVVVSDELPTREQAIEAAD